MNKTADEMFEELGYNKISEGENEIIYFDGIVTISISNFVFEDTKERAFSFEKSFGAEYFSSYIGEQEDKAIHKKIDELKNGKRI